MGLQDYTYRLRAEAGDAAPHDELGISGNLSGGTIALVDRGSGDWAWQFSAGMASVAIPSKTITSTNDASGITLALTLRIVNYGTVDFQVFVGVNSGVPSSATDTSVVLTCGRSSSGLLRAKYTSSSITADWSAGTDELTLVMRFETGAANAADRASAWHGATRVDGSGTNAGSHTVNTLFVCAQNGAVVQIKDAVFWPEELADADCVLLRDSGIRPALSAALLAGSATGAGSASGTLSGAARLTSSQLKNNTGTLLTSAACEAFVHNPTTGALIVKKTGLVSHASTAVVTFSDAAVESGSSYRVIWRMTSGGAEGMETLTATAP